MMENYSLSDLRTAVGDNNGFGGNGGDFLLLVLFLFMFGQNGFGGNRGFGEAATAASQNELLLGQQFDRVGQQLTGISNGICDGFYALNNSLKDCCCQTQLGMNDIMAGIHAEGEATRSLIQTNQIQDLRDKVTDLQMRASQCDQNEYLVNKLRPCPVPAYITCSPYQTYNYGCGGYGNGF